VGYFQCTPQVQVKTTAVYPSIPNADGSSKTHLCSGCEFATANLPLHKYTSVTTDAFKFCSNLCTNLPMYRTLHLPLLSGQAPSELLLTSSPIKENSAQRGVCTQDYALTWSCLNTHV